MPIAVSVVTATRNRTDLLGRALRSVAQQTQQDFEAILVDDGSSAEVSEYHERLLRELGSRFQIVKPQMAGARGTGPAAARNRGIKIAQGEFVAFIDDDDEWASATYLETAVTALRRHDADYIFGHLVGERDGRTEELQGFPARKWLIQDQLVSANPNVHELSPATLLTIGKRFLIHPSNSVVRAQTLRDAGGFFEPIWSYGEDLNLMLRVLDASRRVLYIPETVTRYRLPVGDSISLVDHERIHSLQYILAAQEARLHCRRPEFRECARARESWTYRVMAGHATEDGQSRDARAFARQAFATYPTMGAAVFALKMMLKPAKRRVS